MKILYRANTTIRKIKAMLAFAALNFFVKGTAFQKLKFNYGSVLD
jgi:hypothetical protein